LALTTQYGSFVTLARNLLTERGVTVTYGRFDESVAGQPVGGDGRVEQKLQVKVLFRTKFLRQMAGTFMQSTESTALMANNGFKPKPQDYLIEPNGKRSPIEEVTEIAPDGFPILYYLGFREG